MLKKLTFFIILFLFSITSVSAASFDIDIKSENIILYNMTQDKMMFEINADKNTSIASLTKIMTVITAIESIEDINEKVTLTSEVFKGLIEEDASVAGFKEGQIVTLEDLLYGAMLPSGADATRGLAFYISDTEDKFVELMNEKAKSIGVENTIFKNSSGLDAKGQTSTVKDVLEILKYALKNEIFKEIYTTNTYTTSDDSLTFKSVFSSISNRYDLDMPYIIGSKTGYTDDAGLCFSSYVTYDNQEFILITTKAFYEDEYTPYNVMDANNIYNYVFDNYGNQILVSLDEILFSLPVKISNITNYEVKSSKEVIYYMENDYDENDIEYVYEGLEELTSKNKIGDTIGICKVMYKGEIIDEIKIILDEEIPFSIIVFLQTYYFIPITIGALILLIMVLLIFRKLKLRRD